MIRFNVLVLLSLVYALCLANGKTLRHLDDSLSSLDAEEAVRQENSNPTQNVTVEDPKETTRSDNQSKENYHHTNHVIHKTGHEKSKDDKVQPIIQGERQTARQPSPESPELPIETHHKRRHHHKTPNEPENDIDSQGDKEDIPETPAEEEFHSVPMPTAFQSYDIIHKDGYITLDELISVSGAVENVDKAFAASDIDGDGRLSRAEFQTAPWMLQGDPTNSVNEEEAEEKLESSETKPSNLDVGGDTNVTDQGQDNKSDAGKE